MVKKTLLVTILLAACVCSSAFGKTDKPVVAVLHFETDGCPSYLSDVVAVYLMTAVAYMGQYEVVAPEKITKAMEGSGVKTGGAISNADAVALAKKLGAVIAARGKVSKKGSDYTITVDFINAATGAPVMTKSANVTGEANLSKGIDKIVGLTD